MQAELDALERAFDTSGASGDGDRRRREDFHQARSARTSDVESRDADHRRRHGQHLPRRARQAVGKSLCENDLIPNARDILAKAKALGREIVLPVDVVVAQKLAEPMRRRASSRVDQVGADDMILDIGPRSIEHAIAVLGPIQNAGLERPVRRLRDQAVRQWHRRGRQGGGGTHASRQACQFCRRRRHGGGAQCRGRDRTVSPMSRPRAARSWNGSKARRCRASKCCWFAPSNCGTELE